MDETKRRRVSRLSFIIMGLSRELQRELGDESRIEEVVEAETERTDDAEITGWGTEEDTKVWDAQIRAVIDETNIA